MHVGERFRKPARRNPERDFTGEKLGRRLAAQSSNRAADVSRHLIRSTIRWANSAEDIPSEGRSERRIVAGEPGFVREYAAVEGSSHPLHMRADAEVTDPHLAKRAVEIGEHLVEKALAERARLRPIRLEAMKIKKRMKANQFKAPVECVRHAIVSEENPLPGLLDDPSVRDVCSLSGRITS